MFSVRGTSRLWALLAVSWGALVYVNALTVHRPNLEWVGRYFWPPVGAFSWAACFHAQAGHLFALSSLGIFDIVCWGLGVRALVWLGQNRVSGAFGLGVRFVAGAALVGFAAMGLALTGLAYPAVYAGLAIVGASCFPLRPPLGGWRRVVSASGFSIRKALADFPGPLKVFSFIMVFAAVAGAMAPEATDDALRFMLEIPRRALILHRLIPEGHLPLTWTPWLPHVISLPLVALAGEVPVKLLNTQGFILVALLVAEWLRADRRTRAFAPYAAASWLALLNVSVLAHTAMTDCASVSWLLLAVIAQFRWRRPILAGLLWGGAIGFKYQSGIFLAGAVMAELVFNRAFAWRVLAPALIVGGTWLVRNELFTGSPLAPFFMAWGEGSGSVVIPDFFYRVKEWLDYRTVGAWLAAPYLLATRITMWDALLSPLLVACLPLAFMPATSARMKIFLAVALVTWGWAVGNNGRYLLPLAPILLVVAWRNGPSLLGKSLRGWPLKAVFTLALVYEASMSLHWGFYIFNPLSVALGREDRATYLARVLVPRPTTWQMGERMRTILEPDSRYYLVGANHAHYWPGLPMLDAEFSPPQLAAWASACTNAGRLRVKLRQRGINFLVSHETAEKHLPGLLTNSDGWSSGGARVYREMFFRYARLRFRLGSREDSYALYELGGKR